MAYPVRDQLRNPIILSHKTISGTACVRQGDLFFEHSDLFSFLGKVLMMTSASCFPPVYHTGRVNITNARSSSKPLVH